jgi:hypothetical protein
VHHVIPASEFAPGDLRIDAEEIDGQPQLVGVCHRCHVTETSRQQNAWKRRPDGTPASSRDFPRPKLGNPYSLRARGCASKSKRVWGSSPQG